MGGVDLCMFVKKILPVETNYETRKIRGVTCTFIIGVVKGVLFFGTPFWSMIVIDILFYQRGDNMGKFLFTAFSYITSKKRPRKNEEI